MTSPVETTDIGAVLDITEEALTQIIALRDEESIEGLSLGIRVAGVTPNGFTYETAFVRPEDVLTSDHVEEHGGLTVTIDAGSVDDIRGSVLDVSSDPNAPGLVLRNPNQPSPVAGGPEIPDIELEGTVEERVAQLLEQAINPAIAAHGGYARLVSVEAETAFLQLGGGCQGCGLAAVTLRNGIETAIKQNVPEITEIVDVTDHAAGANRSTNSRPAGQHTARWSPRAVTLQDSRSPGGLVASAHGACPWPCRGAAASLAGEATEVDGPVEESLELVAHPGGSLSPMKLPPSTTLLA